MSLTAVLVNELEQEKCGIYLYNLILPSNIFEIGNENICFTLKSTKRKKFFTYKDYLILLKFTNKKISFNNIYIKK